MRDKKSLKNAQDRIIVSKAFIFLNDSFVHFYM